MRLTAAFVLMAALAAPPSLQAQIGPGAKPAEPFKVGTFEIHGVPHVGLVLRDSLVVDIEVANLVLQNNPSHVRVAAPRDMIELIGQYDYGLKYRLYEIVNYLVADNRLTTNRPDFVYDLKAVKTMAPIQYPGKILNAAVNFYSHCPPSRLGVLPGTRRLSCANWSAPELKLGPTPARRPTWVGRT